MSLLILNRMKNAQVFDPEWLKDANEDLILVTTNDAVFDESKFARIERVADYERSGEVEFVASALLKSLPIRAVISTSEADVLRAARLREFGNLSGTSSEIGEAFRDKIVMKSYIASAGLSVPIHQRIDQPMDLIDFISDKGYPCIVKPVDGAASIETEILYSDEETLNFLKREWRRGFEVETLARGELYHIDGFIRDNHIVVCWPSKYRTDCLAFKTGGYSGSFMLEPTHPLRQRLQRYAADVLRALPGPKNFPFHLEVFVDDAGELTFLEVAARTGGGRINSTFEKAFGINLNQCYVRSQAGLPLPLNRYVTEPRALYGWALIPPREGFRRDGFKPRIEFGGEYVEVNQKALVRSHADGSVDHVVALEIRDSALAVGLEQLDEAVFDVERQLSSLRHGVNELY